VHIFHTPIINTEFYTLNEEESKHCVRVLRLKEGDNIQLIDGQGGYYEAEIVEAHVKRCYIKIINKTEEFGKRKNKLIIAIAPTKNINRFEFFLEKATEIGIDEIIPLRTQFSERTTIKNERLEKVIVSAAKQSVKAYIPKLRKLTTFKNLISEKFSGKKLIAHCYDGKKDNLIDTLKNTTDALILIGPEGDFSINEVQVALENGFTEVNLSDSRLRTETAGIVACNTFNLAEMLVKK